MAQCFNCLTDYSAIFAKTVSVYQAKVYFIAFFNQNIKGHHYINDGVAVTTFLVLQREQTQNASLFS